MRYIGDDKKVVLTPMVGGFRTQTLKQPSNGYVEY